MRRKFRTRDGSVSERASQIESDWLRFMGLADAVTVQHHNGHREAVLAAERREDVDHYLHQANGRPFTLVIGRRVLDPEVRGMQGLSGRYRQQALSLDMRVRKLPTIFAARYTYPEKPHTADELLSTVEQTGAYAKQRKFAQNCQTVTGSVEITQHDTVVSASFLLDEVSPASEGLWAERALVRSLHGIVPEDDPDMDGPLAVRLFEAEGPKAGMFMEQTESWHIGLDNSEVRLGCMALVPLFGLQRI